VGVRLLRPQPLFMALRLFIGGAPGTHSGRLLYLCDMA